MEVIHNRGNYIDKQLVKVQEIPQTIDVYVYASLVDIGKPGDLVTVTGIYRAVCSDLKQQKI